MYRYSFLSLSFCLKYHGDGIVATVRAAATVENLRNPLSFRKILGIQQRGESERDAISVTANRSGITEKRR